MLDFMPKRRLFEEMCLPGRLPSLCVFALRRREKAAESAVAHGRRLRRSHSCGFDADG